MTSNTNSNQFFNESMNDVKQKQFNDKKKMKVKIDQLINTLEFINYSISIEEMLKDDVTLDELLSSQEVIKKARSILKKYDQH